MSHIKNENSIAKQNVSRKYMSLKEIEDAITNPNFGENIEINTGYCAYPGHSLYQRESLSKSLDYNYNLKPPVYTVPIPPVYAIPIPSFSNTYCTYSNTDSRVSERDCIETPFIKTKKGVYIKKGSNILIKKTCNQYKICINHKGTVKKIFKINNGKWNLLVEIENEEIKKQIIKIHHYLEKNNNKKFKYPFFKDINQEKSWIVIQNKTENFELIEYSNESIVPVVVPVAVPRSISKPANSPISKLADHFDAAYFANVNAEIIAAEAISARLKAKSDVFLNVFNTSLASPAFPAFPASKKQKK